MVSIGTPFKTKTNHLLLGQRGFRTQKQPFLIKNHPIPTQTHSASNTERGWANTNQAAQTWQFLILGLSILLFILFKTHNKQNHNQVPTGQPAYEPDKVHPSQHQLANGIHVNYTKQGLKTWEFIAQYTNNNTEHLFVVRVESAHVIYPNERAELKRHTKQQLQSHTQSNPDDIFESLTQFIQPKQHKKQPPYTIGIARIDVQKTKPTSLHYATNGMLCQIITPTQSTQLPRSSEIRAYTNYNIFKIDLKPSTHLILGNPTKHQNPVLNKTSYINQ
jgi:uncharacterized OB-fold protein